MKKADETAVTIHDEDKLLALLEHPARLGKSEYASFENMQKQRDLGERLSGKQRSWIRDRFRQLGLAATFEPENLVSSGKVVTGTPEDLASKRQLEAMLGPRALRPPPSRPRL